MLYLMLQQNQIHLAKDDSVFLSYQIDLAQIDPKITEKECTVQCARILLELLKLYPVEKENREKKLQRVQRIV